MPAVMVTSSTEVITVRLITVKMAIARIARDLTGRMVNVCSVLIVATVLTVRVSILILRMAIVRNVRTVMTVRIARVSIPIQKIRVVRNALMAMIVRNVRALLRITSMAIVRNVLMVRVRSARVIMMPKLVIARNVRMETTARNVRVLLRMPIMVIVRNVRVSMLVVQASRRDMANKVETVSVVQPITIRTLSTARRNR